MNPDVRILFQGRVMDASTLLPISNSQIMINRAFSSVSKDDGTFEFYVHRKDTVLFTSLGYIPTSMIVSDTLSGREFMAGIYMETDTLAIGEVVIIPRFSNLKYEILNAKTPVSTDLQNARYNVAISGYQGRTSTGVLGDPSDNYSAIRHQQKINAFEKGGIPSDQIAGINPLMIIPAAYLLIKGLPQKPGPYRAPLTKSELDMINKKFLETLEKK